MAVPGYQEFMLPLLRFAADGQEHKIAEAMGVLAQQMKISEGDRQLMLPSGTQTCYYNRICWAVTYLTKSLLLEKTRRGRFKIAPRGAEVLAKSPPHIDNGFLEQFPEYRAFKMTKVGNVRTCFVYHKFAIGHASGHEISTEINYVPERVAHLVTSMMSMGCVVVDATAITHIHCDETA